jgi:hypothetical protein
VAEILAAASRAPSGANIEPGRRTCWPARPGPNSACAVLAAFDEPLFGDEVHRALPLGHPAQGGRRRRWTARRKIGWDMYGLLGIGKGDTERMRAQSARNYGNPSTRRRGSSSPWTR